MSGKKNTGQPFNLTDRQAEIVDAIVQHGSTKLAARQLGISYRTVEGVMGHIRDKMRAPNRVRTVIEWGRARREA
jgi:molybdate transport repressor ModE-like protein